MAEDGKSKPESLSTITDVADWDAEEKRREHEARLRKVREREKRGEFDDMPHMVSFHLEYEQAQGITCRTRAYPDKAEAQDAKSKLEQAEGVFGAEVERL